MTSGYLLSPGRSRHSGGGDSDDGSDFSDISTVSDTLIMSEGDLGDMSGLPLFGRNSPIFLLGNSVDSANAESHLVTEALHISV